MYVLKSKNKTKLSKQNMTAPLMLLIQYKLIHNRYNIIIDKNNNYKNYLINLHSIVGYEVL